MAKDNAVVGVAIVSFVKGLPSQIFVGDVLLPVLVRMK